MTHRQLPGKVPIILVEQRKLNRKITHRQRPGNVPIIIVEQEAKQVRHIDTFQARFNHP